MNLSFSRNQSLKLKNTVLMVIFKSSFGAYVFLKKHLSILQPMNYIAQKMINVLILN